MLSPSGMGSGSGDLFQTLFPCFSSWFKASPFQSEGFILAKPYIGCCWWVGCLASWYQIAESPAPLSPALGRWILGQKFF